MLFPEKRFLFTIREAAHACGVSRATLLRMEESGFLTPHTIDPDTGYRYYDAQNIAQIGQYQLLQELGLPRNEIVDIYFQKIDMIKFIDSQKEKVSRLQRLISTLELRTSHELNHKCSFIDLPEITCYCKTEKNLSRKNVETQAYAVHQEAIKAGYQMQGNEPMFLFVKADKTHTQDGKEPTYEFTVCIPVVTSDPEGANLKTFPKCQAFSFIGYGDYSELDRIFEQFREEITSRKLEPIGSVRIIAHVATYVGPHISHNDFCYELAVPIKSI